MHSDNHPLKDKFCNAYNILINMVKTQRLFRVNIFYVEVYQETINFVQTQNWEVKLSPNIYFGVEVDAIQLISPG